MENEDVTGNSKKITLDGTTIPEKVTIPKRHYFSVAIKSSLELRNPVSQALQKTIYSSWSRKIQDTLE